MSAEVRPIGDALEIKGRRLRGELTREMPRPEKSLSKREVAEHYGVSTTTIDDWCRAQGMPWRRVGSRRKFRLSETDAWMRAAGKMD